MYVCFSVFLENEPDGSWSSLAHHPLHDSSIHVFNETMQPQTRVCLAFGVQTREEETIEWVNPSDIHTEAVEVVHVSVQHT